MVSAKLENSFLSAKLAITQAQLSKLELQQALLSNSGQIVKNEMFICPSLPIVHRKSTLHNFFYFNTHWLNSLTQSHKQAAWQI